MERRQAHEFPQELLDLFDLYQHGDIDRRTFLDRAKVFAIGGMSTAVLFEALRPHYAWAQQVAPDDARIRTERATVPSPQGNGTIAGLLARPASGGPFPAVLVVHENRGLNPYIEDVARRFAVEGFLAFAPDGLTSVGGYPGNDEEGGRLFQTVDRMKMLEDFVASVRWLQARPDSTGRVGAVGFCFGGGVASSLAVRLPDLGAAVSFYGAAPSAEDAAKIKAPVLVHHGEMDTRLVGSWPAYEAALKAAGATHEGYVYPGAQHGFHNDTTPRYDEAAATLAWQRTIAWFSRYLRG
ncbi:MAG: dienelactone hydrolase [Acidobacteria bacterium SCN 69-37]|nr:MAG: dienelactone hydrolase [Acidobacteria bacterium SCN 69-37]